jgi:hypothetical protein
LEWDEVRSRILAALEPLSDVNVLLYRPRGAPKAEAMRIATKRPNMTPGRAALIGVLKMYAVPGYRLSMLEIQKLAYLLQESGEKLRLNFSKGTYGPYTETLHHVLQRMEGHFIRGYGDRSRDASIRVLNDASEEARDFLENRPDSLEHLKKVSMLIEGFETPYGLELLTTVHWLAKENPDIKQDSAKTVSAVQDWSEQKRRKFRPHHVKMAWSHLNAHGWL